MKPEYDLDKIKFATDRPTLERAIALYENKKITRFKEDLYGYSAIVIGTQPYNVFVSAKGFDRGSCNCYLGQNDTLCKHMVALAMHAVTSGRGLSEEDKKIISEPRCSGKLGDLKPAESAAIKSIITQAMRYIKPYNGPSRIWFSYQNSLSEGCNRLAKIVSELPVSRQTAKLIVNILLRLDRKLSTGGVDDSDGTVGGFIQETVGVLRKYYKIDPSCVKVFKKFKNRSTCFDWEEPLLNLK